MRYTSSDIAIPENVAKLSIQSCTAEPGCTITEMGVISDDADRIGASLMEYFDAKVLQVRDDTYDALAISLEYDTDPTKTYPVFLFTPDMNNTDNHFHIELSIPQAIALRQWLQDNVPQNSDDDQ